MSYPAQTKSGKIVQIVDKAICATGQLVEVFTDEDGVKYTRDLAGAYAPHILIPLEESIEMAESAVAAGAAGAAGLLAKAQDILAEAKEKATDVLEEAHDAVDEIEDALGVQDDTPATEENPAPAE